MGKIQALETGLSMLWKVPKGKINPETLRYVPKKNISSNADEFIRTTEREFSTAPREIKKQDIGAFRHYLLLKKMDLKITAEELKTLFAYEGEEYKLKAFELLTKKMNIPKELIPQFVYSDAKKGTAMFYDYSLNWIAVNPSLNVEKAQFLALLRHELQHFSQNMQMFRHETKGMELAEIFSKMNAKINCKNIDHYARNVDIEQLKQILNEEDLKQISYLKELIKDCKTEEYNYYMQLLEKTFTDYHMSAYTDFRKKVVDTLGVLKKDTKEGKRVEKMFNETAAEQSYWEQDGQIHYGKYFSDCRENEALAAQDSMMMNILRADNQKKCYIREMRTQSAERKAAEPNSKLENDIKETKQERKDKGISFKEFLSYLYD